ncbi:SRPBCC family protein [Pseudonocardia sp. MH-G8]|uniref:SRPBCC family protein n=1 Tax=Pseudonocardia sp. MH-G8 TaxID=1854588 RepID=UPI000BA07D8A|nr:SRPBCC family protein [Pseudonocardia sp. MH-G8]OZM83718.1 MxaD family protein [Pseudonocardia sp. MH-G8]
MATLRKDVVLGADAADVWDALRDFTAVHQRLCPGVLVDSRPGPGGRLVTFAAGPVVDETLVAVEPEERRLVYAVAESPFPFAHHQASMQVFPSEMGSRLVWITDLLPDDLAPDVSTLMEEGAAAMRRVFPVPGDH